MDTAHRAWLTGLFETAHWRTNSISLSCPAREVAEAVEHLLPPECGARRREYQPPGIRSRRRYIVGVSSLDGMKHLLQNVLMLDFMSEQRRAAAASILAREYSPRARVPKETKAAIKAALLFEGLTQRAAAERFDVSVGTVAQIARTMKR